MLKRCGKCKQYKPRERFSKDKNRLDGLYCNCKDCVSAYVKQYRAHNKDKLLKCQTVYREAHREELNERGRQRYVAHRAEESVRGRKYRRDNADRVRQCDRKRYYATIEYQRERSKRYRENNPELARERNRRAYEQHPERWRRYNHNRRTQIKGNGGYYTDLEWEGLKAQYDYTCLCCGQRESGIRLTVDHVIPISKGGSNDIQISSPFVRNAIKAKMTGHRILGRCQ
jgi:5-methylcytosine-specific restriction endonuclease McrA